MKVVTALPVLAALALTVPALAQEAPPPDRAAAFAKHRADMCTDHYAHAVGKIAELETRLALTSAQKAPFEHWKDIKLKHAKAASAECADFKPLGPDASLLDRREKMIAHLEKHLAALKAETPALEALVKSLTREQQTVLKHAAREAIGDHMMMMHRHGARFGEGRFGDGHPGEGRGPMTPPMDAPQH